MFKLKIVLTQALALVTIDYGPNTKLIVIVFNTSKERLGSYHHYYSYT